MGAYRGDQGTQGAHPEVQVSANFHSTQFEITLTEKDGSRRQTFFCSIPRVYHGLSTVGDQSVQLPGRVTADYPKCVVADYEQGVVTVVLKPRALITPYYSEEKDLMLDNGWAVATL